MSTGFWELRLYEMLPRRLPDMLHQLQVEIPPLFARAGVPAPLAAASRGRGAASAAGPQTATLVYLLHWPNLDERMAAWGRFYADPQWWRQYEDAHGGEQMLERSHVLILQAPPAGLGATDPAAFRAGGLHELRRVDLHPGAPGAAHEALAHRDLPFLAERGARVLGHHDTCIGPRLPQAAVLLAWPDGATRDAALAACDDDGALRAARDAERRAYGAALLGNTAVSLLRPVT